MKPSLARKKTVLIPLILLILFILAIRSYSLVIPNRDENPPSTLERIETFFNDRDKLEDLLDSREASSGNLEAHLSWKLGDMAESKPLYQSSLAEYIKIINDPNSTNEQLKQALQQAAKINIQLGNFNEAIELCQKGLEIYPKNSSLLGIIAEVYYLRAVACQNSRQDDQTIGQLENILALDNLEGNWYAFTKNWLAHLHFKKGEGDKAISYYQSIIEDYPGLDNWKAIAHYDLAQYYLNKKDIPKAQEHLKALVNNHPYSVYTAKAKDKLKELAR